MNLLLPAADGAETRIDSPTITGASTGVAHAAQRLKLRRVLDDLRLDEPLRISA